MERRIVFSGNPYEGIWGHSRAVRVGDHISVSGTAPIPADGSDPPGDAYGQTRLCLQIIVKALADAGARAEDVVRTRVYGTSADLFDDVARAHREVFGEIHPASAFVVIKELANPAWLVEIEADAIASA
ncbi:MAG: RidA family protein [Gaiellaceae bacterium]|jgi:enamine deaminase RidA (YjgF/YER057c/UK114 family)